jgi:hypothetical protein
MSLFHTLPIQASQELSGIDLVTPTSREPHTPPPTTLFPGEQAAVFVENWRPGTATKPVSMIS